MRRVSHSYFSLDSFILILKKAVGSYLALHRFTLQTKKDADIGKNLTITPSHTLDNSEWQRGKIYAEAQILARELAELPANMVTPTVCLQLY